jgi:hypothetical protein
MEISIHDNIIYGYQVKCDDYSSSVYQLVLYTEYFGPNQKVEYTDVVFSNVITHRFDAITSKTVLFDIEETQAQLIYEQDEELFLRLKNYGWPFQYQDLDDLLHTFDKKSMRAFRVHSSCGLDGWVWAEKMKLISRMERKEFN